MSTPFRRLTPPPRQRAHTIAERVLFALMIITILAIAVVLVGVRA